MPEDPERRGSGRDGGERKKLTEWVAWRDDPLRQTRRDLLIDRDGVDGGSVTLRPENEDAATVYMMTRGQVITAGEGTVVDVSIPAIKIVMDLLGVQDQRRCLEKVVRVFHQIENARTANAD